MGHTATPTGPQAGAVTHFNATTGTGFIRPDDDGATNGQSIPFAKKHFRQAGADPRERQRFAYDIATGEDGEPHAINLRPE